MKKIIGLALATSLLGACASPDRVLFVTKTNLGIDVDLKTNSTDIGFSRVEGYIAPRFGKGVAPPVVATFKKDKGFFPNVMQRYATGEAAVLLLNKDKTLLKKNPKMVSDRPSEPEDMMFVGTSTRTGLSIAYEAGAVGFNFGYKRREFSLIPLYKENEGDRIVNYYYPSVVASLSTGVVGEDKTKTQTINQFFAVGVPAKYYAYNVELQEFMTSDTDAFPNYNRNKNTQIGLAKVIMTCYSAAGLSTRPAIWDDASKLGVIRTPDKPIFDSAKAAGASPKELEAANTRYRKRVENILPTSKIQTESLKKHKKTVCA